MGLNNAALGLEAEPRTEGLGSWVRFKRQHSWELEAASLVLTSRPRSWVHLPELGCGSVLRAVRPRVCLRGWERLRSCVPRCRPCLSGHSSPHVSHQHGTKKAHPHGSTNPAPRPGPRPPLCVALSVSSLGIKFLQKTVHSTAAPWAAAPSTPPTPPRRPASGSAPTPVHLSPCCHCLIKTSIT